MRPNADPLLASGLATAADFGSGWVDIPLSTRRTYDVGFTCGHRNPVYRDVVAVIQNDARGLQINETISRPSGGAIEAMRGIRSDLSDCGQASGITVAPDFPHFGEDSFTIRTVSSLNDGTKVYGTVTYVRRANLLLMVAFSGYLRYPLLEEGIVRIADNKFLQLAARIQ